MAGRRGSRCAAGSSRTSLRSGPLRARRWRACTGPSSGWTRSRRPTSRRSCSAGQPRRRCGLWTWSGHRSRPWALCASHGRTSLRPWSRACTRSCAISSRCPRRKSRSLPRRRSRRKPRVPPRPASGISTPRSTTGIASPGRASSRPMQGRPRSTTPARLGRSTLRCLLIRRWSGRTRAPCRASATASASTTRWSRGSATPCSASLPWLWTSRRTSS
mmetsp:Transcript_35245/g.93388  ORF Transcript_35245/g.93388 Transcript_35245/m.93388 type:complete len:217 (+) Transcript_35245:46-696(+)